MGVPPTQPEKQMRRAERNSVGSRGSLRVRDVFWPERKLTPHPLDVGRDPPGFGGKTNAPA